jgi:O-antigen ligase
MPKRSRRDRPEVWHAIFETEPEPTDLQDEDEPPPTDASQAALALLPHVCAVAFVLFLIAPTIKGVPFLQSVPFDLTAIFAGLAALVLMAAVLLGVLSLRRVTLPLMVAAMLLLGWMAASLAWVVPESMGVARHSVVMFGGLAMLSISGACLLLSAPGGGSLVYTYLAAAAIPVAIVNILVPVDPATEISPALGSNRLLSAELMGIGLIAVTGLFVEAHQTYRRWFWVFAAVIMMVALPINGSRGPLVAIPLAAAILGIYAYRNARNISGRSWLVAGAVAALVLIGVLLVAGHIRLEAFRSFRRIEELPGEHSLASRGDLFADAARLFSERPFFGWGISSFGDLIGAEPGYYPHNLVLQGLCELGLLGGALMLVIMVYPLVRGAWAAWRAPRGWTLATLGAGVFVGLQLLKSGDIVGSRVAYAMLALCCLDTPPLAGDHDGDGADDEGDEGYGPTRA